MSSKKSQLVVEYRYPTEQDIIELCNNMRESDIEEINKLSNMSVDNVVLDSVKKSDERYCLAVIVNGSVACIFGVVPYCAISQSGICWMLGTHVLDDYAFSLTKVTRNVIKYMLNDYCRLFNVILSSSKSTIKWLRIIGFKFSESVLVGDNEVRSFEIRSKVCV